MHGRTKRQTDVCRYVRNDIPPIGRCAYVDIHTQYTCIYGSRVYTYIYQYVWVRLRFFYPLLYTPHRSFAHVCTYVKVYV